MSKSVILVRINRTLKVKVFKLLTALSRSVDIDRLDEIVDKYKNICQRTIKTRPADAVSGRYIAYTVKHKKNKFLRIRL